MNNQMTITTTADRDALMKQIEEFDKQNALPFTAIHVVSHPERLVIYKKGETIGQRFFKRSGKMDVATPRGSNGSDWWLYGTQRIEIITEAQSEALLAKWADPRIYVGATLTNSDGNFMLVNVDGRASCKATLIRLTPSEDGDKTFCGHSWMGEDRITTHLGEKLRYYTTLSEIKEYIRVDHFMHP